MRARTPPPGNRILPAPAGTHPPGRNRRCHPAPLLLALLALASCEGGPGGGPETPTALTIRSGDGQTADARTAVPDPPTVLVTGASGNGVGGVTVNFTVYSGGGSVASATAVTGTNGVASAGAWTLGDPGPQELRASVAGLNPVLFTATAVDVPTTLVIHAGDGQRAVAGAAVPGPVQVRVTGVAGAALEGVTVGFEVTAGGGSVESATAATDADGIASPGAWTLGDPGPQELRATVAGLDPVLLTATALDVPTTLAIHAGDGQRAFAGAAVPSPVQVRVTGVAGAALEGVTVGFEVTAGGGSVESATAATDADGIASPGAWTLGDPGPQELRATVAGLNPVLFTATALDVPTTLVIHAGDGQRAVAGAAVPGPVQVRITGVAGTALEGVTVAFEVTAGGGSVESATAATDADGIASPGAWTLGDPGPQELRATVAGLDPVLFTATAVDVPTTLAIHAGDGQRAFAGAAVPSPVQVRVTGVAGAALEGVTVGFEVTAGGGSVESATAATDADGIASPGAWTLGDPGPQELRATVAGLDPVTVRATALKVPARVAVVAGTGQEVPVATPVPVPPAVLVSDSAGAPLPGVTVTFETGGGAGITGARAVTDTLGRAAVGSWTLGTTAGVYRLEAAVDGDGIEGNPAFIEALAVPGPASEIVIVAGDDQVSEAKLPVPVSPRIQVRDAHGNGVDGLTARFEAGGGSVAVPSRSETGGGGFAGVDRWILGARENVGYRLTAEVHDGDRSVGTVRFAATSTPSVYDIVIEHTDPSVLSEAQLAAFAKAESFWEKAVRGNLGWSTLRRASLEWCLSLAEIDYEIPGDRVVDDLLIYADTREVDGPGGILAGAGPCQIRREGSLPVVGVMFFDIEDMDALETQEGGRHLDGTILHEMAHVMGFGTLWEYVGLLEDPVDPNNPTGMEDPHFVGDSALKAFSGIGGDDYTAGEPVPAENLGGTGVVNGHWRESVFLTELMSPFIDGGVPNPLSVVTLASFQDLGYRQVDLSVADEYELPSAAAGHAAAALADLIATGGDILRIPMAVVDRDGRVIRYVLPGGR